MGVMCPTGLSRPGGWWRTHPGSHLGERFNDASAGMFQRTPALCLCCSHVSPHSGLVLWFPKFLAMFDGKGFSDRSGAIFALCSLPLQISPWFLGAG